MVVRVKLAGLNIRQSRGKWYVSIRKTGDSLVRGFAGTRAELDKHLEEPHLLRTYGALKSRDRRPVYGEGSLGDLVRWFKDECPRWRKLSEATKADYEKSFLYLEPEFDALIDTLEQADIYEAQNQAANAKWWRFADKMVSHLSTMFREAMKVRRAARNPAAGVEKMHKADPNANHEWLASEVETVAADAPRQFLTPILIARHAGFSGQTIASLQWSAYIQHPEFGRALQAVRRKNNVSNCIPCAPVLKTHLDGLTRTATAICTREDGTPWESEKQMQSAVSIYLKTFKEKELIRPGCTLHGLRVTYAADIRRRGHDTGTVADALGDRSKAMGEHYTRHVEREASLIRIFRGRDVVQNG